MNEEQKKENEELESTSLDDEVSEESVPSTSVDQEDKLQEQLQEKSDQILRLSAEIKNMQRRFTNERNEATKYRSQSLATSLLSVVDSLERALDIEADDDVSESLKKGIEMVYSNLISAFESEDIKTINPLGELFDPNFHQSISSVPIKEGQKPDEVVEVYQKGYVLHDRVLRPAMVIIAQ